MLRPKRRDPRPIGGGVCELDLTRGFVALIDEADAELVSRFTWIADVRSERQVYCLAQAEPGAKSGKIRMHRLVMGCTKGDRRVIDHISGVGTDNRKANLRFCTAWQNCVNRRVGNKYKGVSDKGNAFDASITFHQKEIFLGRFKDAESAARIYNFAASYLHGDFASLNDVPMDRPCVPRRSPKTGVLGVHKHGRQWMVYADRKYRGLYKTIEQAANVHDAVMVDKFGPLARTNRFFGLLTGFPQVNESTGTTWKHVEAAK